MSKATIYTEKAPKAIGPYAQAVAGCGSLLYTSGQLGIDAGTGSLAEGVEAQTHHAMKNIGEILKAAGLTYDHIVKTTIFVVDLADFLTVNQVYAGCFGASFPARSCVQVAALPLGGLVEIECVAMKE